MNIATSLLRPLSMFFTYAHDPYLYTQNDNKIDSSTRALLTYR